MVPAVEVAGIVLGALVILTICRIWWQRGEVSRSSLVGLAVGALLVTASVWAHVRIEADADGFKVDLTRLENQVRELEHQNAEVLDKTLKLAEATETTTTALLQIGAAASLDRQTHSFDRGKVLDELTLQSKNVRQLRAGLTELRVERPPG